MIARHPSALWRDTPSSLLVLSAGDEVVRLVGPGRQLWLALEEPRTLTELAAAVGGRRGALAEAEAFVAGLQALGLVVEAPG